MAKVNTSVWDKKTEAVKEFTDREEPQEAFERKFRVLYEDWKNSYYVLCYYGIGGIGKTSFKYKLRGVIQGEEKPRLLDKIDCNYIEYDFGTKNSTTDKAAILSSLRNQLSKINKDFQFFRFDYALCSYAQQMGEEHEKKEAVKSLLETTPWLKGTFSLVELIPVIGSVAEFINKIDDFTMGFKGTLRQYMDKKRFRNYLNDVDSLEPSQILDNLHEYFCRDMVYNMQQVAKKPIVVFLDTYEKYIDTVNDEIDMVIEDYWLRKGAKSVIQGIPGLLWVITGREKLYWGDEWEELVVDSPLSEITEEEKEKNARMDLEQHLLGDLSEKDAIRFLSKAGVKDIGLCKQMYQLTSGTPLFLDMCVETYEELEDKGIEPVIEDFGKDLTRLINRYLHSMNESNREMMYLLACLGTWDDEYVKTIASKATTLHNYSYTKYRDFVDHTFIIKDTDGSYYMHQTVRIAALKKASEEMVNEISELRFTLAKKSLEESVGMGVNVTITEYIKIFEEKKFSYEEIYENVKLIGKQLVCLSTAGNYNLMYTIAKKAFDVVKKSFPVTNADYYMRGYYSDALIKKGYGKEALEIVEVIPLEDESIKEDMIEWRFMLMNISVAYNYNGMYRKSVELTSIVLEESIQVLGKDHLFTLESMNDLAVGYKDLGNYEKSIEIHQEVYEKRREILGENHPATLTSMNNLAIGYSGLGNYAKSIEIYQEVYEKRREILGENHPATLSSMNNLAIGYSGLGNYAKSIEIHQEVYEKQREILGENHPATLSSMYNLAIGYNYLGNYEKSIEIQQEVYEKQREILGENHPDALASMNNLAIGYRGLGNYAKSIEIYQEVYEKRREILGENHPATLSSMNNLAVGYNDLGNYEKSIEIQQEVYEKQREILGENHPDTLSSMNNLVKGYSDLGNYEKLIELFQEVYEKEREKLGEENLETLISAWNLALAYGKWGNYEKSIELFQEVYEKRREILGEEHLETLDAMYNLAVSYSKFGDYEKSIELLEKVYEKRREILGEDDPETLRAKSFLEYEYSKHW